MAEHRALPILQAAGFSASVDAFAWERDPDPDARQMLSFEALGRARFCALAPERPRGWRFFAASLPAAAGYQGVLVPETALYANERTDFLLLPRRAEDAAGLHYRFVNRRLDLPLHASWADWLWQRALRTGEAVALEAQGLAAYRCAPDAEALAADLTAAVRRGVLRIAEVSA